MSFHSFTVRSQHRIDCGERQTVSNCLGCAIESESIRTGYGVGVGRCCSRSIEGILRNDGKETRVDHCDA